MPVVSDKPPAEKEGREATRKSCATCWLRLLTRAALEHRETWPKQKEKTTRGEQKTFLHLFYHILVKEALYPTRSLNPKIKSHVLYELTQPGTPHRKLLSTGRPNVGR